MIDATDDLTKPAGRNISIALADLTVMVYKATTHAGWNSHVHYSARNVETGEADSFGSVNQYPTEPTAAEIAEHVVDQLRHEVEEQLGLKPHGNPA